jgi:hypothetical protein
MLKKRRPEITFGFLLATVFWIGVLGWQASYAPTEMEKQECQDAAKRGSHKTEECRNLWERTTTDPVAFFTFWLAISTIGLGVSTILLWRAGENQKRLMADTAERQLRAYVNVAGGKITFEQPDAPEWHLVVKNFGQTPAYDVRHWTHIWITEYPLSVELPVPDPDFPMSNSILAPGNHEDMVWKKEPPIPANSLELIGTPAGTIFIYGEIRYVDAFGKHRLTRYRLIYGGQTPNRVGFLKPDREGNEAT